MSQCRIKFRNLKVGDIIVGPFETLAKVKKIKPFGSRAIYINFQTEYGWTRAYLDEKCFVDLIQYERLRGISANGPNAYPVAP